MNKKQKQLRRNAKIFIVLLMALGMIMSAILPIFAAEAATLEEVQRAVRELRGEKDDIEEEVTEMITECYFNERVDAVWGELESIGETIAVAAIGLSRVPDSKVQRVSISRVPTGFTFNNTLRQRVVGRDVRYLQILLNADPATRIASSGPGSPGKETELFGDNTRTALMRFQRKYGLPASGDFLTETRNKANELLRSGISITVSTESEKEVYRDQLRGVLSRVRTVTKQVEELREMREHIITSEE